MELRPYQAECIETIEAQPPGAFLAQMATGLGKTVTFANIPRHGERMLILSHREELVEQPRKYFNCSYGIERAKQHSHGEEVVSASIQTLARRLSDFDPEDFRLIICDEAHHAAASTYRKIFDYFRPEKLIGFTATPNRGDKVRLDTVFSKIIFQRDLCWGVKNGYSAAGVTEYEYMATMDARTCEVCGALDGKHFPIKDATPGVNFPPMHPNDRCTTVEYDPDDAADWAASGEKMPESMTYEEWKDKQGIEEESDVSDTVRRAAKSLVTGKKVVSFSALPQEVRKDFRAGLNNANPEVAKALRKVYRDVDYAISKKEGSIHLHGVFSKNTVVLGSNSSPGTIAHELFHEMDADRAISSGLTLAIAQDQVSLNMASNGDIKAYLQMKYPNAVRTKKSGDIALNNPYRGIADILNGMSGGKEWYGFGHSKKYWKTPGNLEAEAWAQFGRTYYNNDPDVKKMFEDIFPNLSTHAMMALKGLI